MFRLSAMPDMNTTRASVDPDPLIGEVVGDTPGAVLARAAFTAILEGQTPVLSELTRATAASSEVGGLVGRGLMLDDTGHVVGAHGLSLVPAHGTLLQRCGLSSTTRVTSGDERRQQYGNGNSTPPPAALDTTRTRSPMACRRLRCTPEH